MFAVPTKLRLKPQAFIFKAAPPRCALGVCNSMVKSINLLVVAAPDAPELKVLQTLPTSVKVLAIGQQKYELEMQLKEAQQDWSEVEVVLNCGVGEKAGKKKDIEQFFPEMVNLKWLHSASAGLENLLFPALVESDVVVTNAKGVYSHSLAEYALTVCSWFAKDFPRLIKAKAERSWDPYDVEELRSKTMGIIGLGDIGFACAKLAKAFKMNVVGLRRRVEMSEEEQKIVDKIFTPDEIVEMAGICDYLIASTPYTPATYKIVSESVIQALKKNAVFVNVGRGKCVDEEALIYALQQKRIRGAGLDVFVTEPLPSDSPLWGLDNVFMSPHCADRTKEFQYESLQFFVQNIQRYRDGIELCNVCDKKSGY
eukprot:TRINITY_DN5413_c0_g1_i4.p1 TRINITY_DN5413_c0_g1~~TRINITY_DN5413_c0_g1_i4.p1  ORF type:complete len:369 (+),score=66.54 TRINITY_DN5413_c0_g1_i4:121-1227(+)